MDPLGMELVCSLESTAGCRCRQCARGGGAAREHVSLRNGASFRSARFLFLFFSKSKECAEKRAAFDCRFLTFSFFLSLSEARSLNRESEKTPIRSPWASPHVSGSSPRTSRGSCEVRARGRKEKGEREESRKKALVSSRRSVPNQSINFAQLFSFFLSLSSYLSPT